MPSAWRAASSLRKNQVHEQADDHREDDRADGAGDTQLEAQHPGGEDDRQHVDGRSRVEKSGRRPETGAALVDAGEERQHRAGADRQDGARHRGHRVGHELARDGAQVLHDRALADEDADGAGDEEGRHQAEQHVLLGVPLEELQPLAHGGHESARCPPARTSRRQRPPA